MKKLKNKTKGFTLMELLTVIVILAVIALIAVPIVVNVNVKVKKASFKQSASGLLDMTNLDRMDNGFTSYSKYIIEDEVIKREGENESIQVENEGQITGTGYIAYTNDGLSAINYTNGVWCATKSFTEKDIRIIEGDCSDVDYLKCEAPVINIKPKEDSWTQYKTIEISESSNKYCRILYSIDGGKYEEYTGNIKIDKNNTKIEAKTVNVGNDEEKSEPVIVEKIDETKPSSVTFVATSTTTKSIKITATGEDEETGISKYAFSKDNGTTWTNYQDSNIYEFDNLKDNKVYQIKVKAYNGTYGSAGAQESLGAAESETQEIKTHQLGVCSITIKDKNNNEGQWAQSKVATITKNGNGQLQYKVLSSAANAEQVLIFTNADSSKTFTINWAASNDVPTYVYCQVTDGTNTTDATYGSASKKEINIDISAPNVAPTFTAVVTPGKTTNSITANIIGGSDSEAPVKYYQYSKDGGSSWEPSLPTTSKTYEFNNLDNKREYAIKVREINETYEVEGQNINNTTESTGTGTVVRLESLGKCTIEIENSEKWATNKKVTITKEGNGQLQYKVLSNEEHAKQVPTYTNVDSPKIFTIDWTATNDIPTDIYCQVTDGTNTTDTTNGSTSKQEVKVDASKPSSATIVSSDKTTNSISVTATGVDSESGIYGYQFSKDDGNTWTSIQLEPSYTFENTTGGTYKVKIKAVNNTYEVNGITANNSTISAATEVKTIINYTSSNYSGVYDGNEHGITVTSSGSTIKYSTSQNGIYTTTKPTYTNVGTYTTYFRVEKEGYTTNTGSNTVTITKSSGSMTAPTAKTLTYTGSDQVLINAGSSNNTGTIQYKLSGGSYTTDINQIKATNAGTYTIYYKVVGDSNHNDVAEASINVTIGKANNTLLLSSNSGTVIYPTATVFTVSTNTSGGALSCSSTNTNAATCSISGTTVTVTPGTTEATNVTIAITSAETPNYKSATANYIVTSQNGVLSVTASGYSGTYDGNNHGITVTSSGATIKYGTSSGSYTLTTSPTRKDVGTTTVYYQVTKTGYKTVTGSKDIVISKAAGSVTAPTAKTLTYIGSDQVLINAGSSTTGTIQYKLSGGSYTTNVNQIKATNAGTYTIYYKVVGDSNHNDVAEASINVTISKAAGSVTAPTAKTLTYTGSNQVLINAGSTTTGTIQYKLSGGSYTTNVNQIKATNAGTYTIYYKVVGNSNHNDVAETSINVTIGKANNTLLLSSNTGTITYPTATTFTVSTNTSGGALSCSSSNTNAATCSISGTTVTVTPGTTEATNVTIAITSAETPNYKSATSNYLVTSQNGVLSVTANGYEAKFDGRAHGITVTSSGATIKYGTSSGSYTLTSSPTYTRIGTYTVYYQVTKTGYKTVTGSKTVIIKSITASDVSYQDTTVQDALDDLFTKVNMKAPASGIGYGNITVQQALDELYNKFAKKKADEVQYDTNTVQGAIDDLYRMLAKYK